MICSSCGAENPAASRFCEDCGTALARICPACGASASSKAKFCNSCGATLDSASMVSQAVTSDQPLAPSAPSAERRLVSVLFADLVEFTTLSESRDAEEVRELLTRYFDTCRKLIGLYGGTIEKFIGDAVMAVWGAPVATEDDAERAVRAALELTAAVAALGQEVSASELEARAGVLTGEAAVTIGAEGQGMVAGDLVNTASRIQSAAPPGGVYVGEVTRRATEETIVYEDTGSHELKGKQGLVQLWRAVRVIAGARGTLKSHGLEAPFVGRDRELRLVKELFHTTADEKNAHLISVVGIAGIGKSRLGWEFYKYFDGLAQITFWHRGRCLSYGEGVTYWALAEMVKMRARISEDEDPASAIAKLHATVEEHVPDAEERRWIEPRLAQLLGLEERIARDREDLFAAWRRFFERLAEKNPCVMVFEDMQWADASLLDFIEYLMEWARSFPIFVVTLGRPDLMERRPNWGAGWRNFTSLFLEPLSAVAMEELMAGLVPGLRDELRSRILERAEGVPLYAVETVRMLLDRGALTLDGSAYRPVGSIETLEVPETLQALIAARLDGLAPEERRLLQDGAVLGKTFTVPGISYLSGLDETELQPLLASLVRKEVLSPQADPRSPEHGQYGFLQDLVKRVANDTLSKKDRKLKHLAAAAFIEETWAADEDEIVEVVASHYLEAYQAAPDAEDAEEIRSKAQAMLVRAGERAGSLAANREAQGYFERAAELAADSSERAELIERAGEMAWIGARNDEAKSHFETALKTFESSESAHPAARVSARLAEIDWVEGRLDEAIDRMEEAFRVLSADEPDEDLATFAAQLGRLHFFKGEMDLAADRVDFALGIAEALLLPEVTSHALQTKGIVAGSRSRPEEALALIGHALRVALDHDLPTAALRAYLNTAEFLCRRDRYEDAIDAYRESLALARRIGNRFWERQLLAEIPYALFMAGRWDEALERAAEVPESELGGADVLGILSALPVIYANRNGLESTRQLLEIFGSYEDSPDVQEKASHAMARAFALLSEGRNVEALASAEEAIEAGLKVGPESQMVKAALGEVADAAFALSDLERVEDLLATIDGFQPGQLSPFVRALAERTKARLAVARNEHDGVAGRFKAAAGLFREIGVPYFLAQTLTDHGEWLVKQSHPDEAGPLLTEAREIFERLGAKPWLERLDKLAALESAGSDA